MRGLEGNFQAQPRVFAHDAKAIVIGAVNTTAENAGVSSLTNAGTGYSIASGAATTVAPAGGTGLNVNILAVDAGVITSFEVNAVGSGYSVGDVVTISGGGGNATFTITNVDIPETKERGCCVYVGAGGNMTVVMESGSSIQFTGLSSGTFLPILVKRVRAATATDLIALY
jgi:hypothetical protein